MGRKLWHEGYLLIRLIFLGSEKFQNFLNLLKGKIFELLRENDLNSSKLKKENKKKFFFPINPIRK